MSAFGFLHPVLALIVWSLLIWILLYIRRIPAMQAEKIAPDSAKFPDGDWKAKMPPKAQAAAHNYNHLMEQPTIFYALMFYLFLVGETGKWIFYLACAYVVLRIIHSLIQVSCGPVMWRFGVFAISTLCLIGMVVLSII